MVCQLGDAPLGVWSSALREVVLALVQTGMPDGRLDRYVDEESAARSLLLLPACCAYKRVMRALPRTPPSVRPERNHLARLVLFVFLLTFMLTRIAVFLIMSRRIPDLYLYVGGTHIHHLNFGIILLAGLGALLLFWQPTGRGLQVAAIVYGVGMALTFDEFGMWIRLGGSYWQQASVDAVGVLAALFGLFAYAPAVRKLRPRHWWSVAILTVVAVVFSILLIESFQYAHRIIGPRLYEIEAEAPR